MSELANELRAIGRAINHDEYVDAGVVSLTLAHAAARIEALEAALDNSQSLLAMIHHLGDEYELTRNLWDGEDLTKLTADQITENRAALAPQEQQDK